MDENTRTIYTGVPETPAEPSTEPRPVPEDGWTAPPEEPSQPAYSAPAETEAFAPPPHRDDPPRSVDSGGRPPKKEKRGLPTAAIVALCLVCALVGGLVSSAAMFARNPVKTETTSSLTTGQRAIPAVETSVVDTSAVLTPVEIYDKYAASTVGITVDVVSTNIWGQTVTGAAAGSGFVITEDGYIVTNYHVIDQANAITVAFPDGTTYPAAVVGGEADNDVAVIKIEAEGLTPVVLGKSGDLQVGEEVVAIGNPLGELTFSETHGIVSALDRVITTSQSEKINMIQTDCAINSGSSGGPLFNNHGEVVGITTAKPSLYAAQALGSTVEGITFAIPIDDVYAIINDLVANGYVTGKPYLGIVMSPYGVSESAQYYGVPAGIPVLGVAEGLAADQAGIQEGDIIVKLNGKETTTGQELSAALAETKPGDQIPVTVYRSGQTLDLTVTIGEETAEAAAATQKVNEEITKKQQEEQEKYLQEQQQNGGGYWPFGF